MTSRRRQSSSGGPLFLPRRSQPSPSHSSAYPMRSPSRSSSTSSQRPASASRLSSSSPSRRSVVGGIVEPSYFDPDKESEARRWLQNLGFDIDSDENSASSLLENPLRNGTLLCALVGLVENVTVPGVVRRPRVLAAALQNVESGLSILRRNKKIPGDLVQQEAMDEICKGNPGVWWRLVWSMKRAYPYAAGRDVVLKQRKLCVYSMSDMRRVESSIVHWLISIGVLSGPPSENKVEEIVDGFRSGVLLCDVVGVLEGLKVAGVNRNPKVAAACRANVYRAMDVLRRRFRMGRRFLRSDEDILRGDRACIFGLLEDLNRSHDGIPPRPDIPQPGEYPYISHPASLDPSHLNGSLNGSSSFKRASRFSSPLCRSDSDHFDHRSSRPSSAPADVYDLQDSYLPPPSKFTLVDYRKKSPSPSLRPQYDILDEARLGGDRAIELERLKGGDLSDRGAVSSLRESDPSLSPPQPSESPDVHTRRSRLANGHDHPPYQNGTTADRSDNEIQRSTLLLNGDRSSAVLDSVERQSANRKSANEPSAAMLTEWLKSLKLPFLSKSFSLDGDVLHEFQNGLLLCSIVEKMDHKALKGVTTTPKSHASYLHNVVKALQVLRNKANMPLDYLWAEYEILDGNRKVILNLLDQIRKAYGKHLSASASRSSTPRR